MLQENNFYREGMQHSTSRFKQEEEEDEAEEKFFKESLRAGRRLLYAQTREAPGQLTNSTRFSSLAEKFFRVEFQPWKRNLIDNYETLSLIYKIVWKNIEEVISRGMKKRNKGQDGEELGKG